MDEFLIKFCVRCKEIKRVKKSDLAKKSCCNKCGSKYVVPEEVNDKVRLEMATRLLASVIINGDGLLQKLRSMSTDLSANLKFKYCPHCVTEEPWEYNFCGCGTELIIPKTERERLLSMKILLVNSSGSDSEIIAMMKGILAENPNVIRLRA